MGTAIAAGRGGIVRRSVLWLSVLASVGGCASIPSSLRNLHRGCSQGNSASCVSLGSALYEGKDPSGGHVDLDYAKARQAFTAGCKRDDAASCQRLGTMLDKGEGGERDKVLAVELWRHSCELGDGVSCSKTAESYMTGSVGIKNNDIAFAYAKTGCEQRDERSCVLWKKLGGTPRVLVAPGEQVARGQLLLVVEAMKMEHRLVADIDGVVATVGASAGALVRNRQKLVEITPAADVQTG